MKEIEVKYLVDKDKWAKIVKPEPQSILQGFLYKSKELVIRVRVKGSKAFLTIKGATEGLTRSEFEYEIPMNEAREMMDQFIDKYIEKERYEITFKGKVWEVDEFKGKLDGLILAELELSSEDEDFDKPEWITDDVSHDPNYYNANLIEQA